MRAIRWGGMLIAILAVIGGIGSATPFAVIGGIAMFLRLLVLHRG